MIYALAVHPIDPDYHPAPAQEENVTAVLQEIIDDPGDIDRRSYARPAEVDAATPGPREIGRATSWR